MSDPVAFGFRALAVARSLVVTSLAVEEFRRNERSHEALSLLEQARSYFTALGMHPWNVVVEINRFQALALLGVVDEVNDVINGTVKDLGRFPVLASSFYEAVFHCQQLVGDADAATNFGHAVEAALESGLRERHERLAAMVEPRT